MYSYPVGKYQSQWENLYNLNTSKEVDVIVNVNNGPGANLDPNFVNAINRLKARGFHVFGYVYTKYGSRNLSDVEYDMYNWLLLYGVNNIDGFFIDETSDNTTYYSYYQNICNYARSNGKLVILNPGWNINTDYFNIADKIVVIETNLKNFNSFAYNNYSSIYPDRVCSIVLGVRPATVIPVMNKMLQNNSSCGYMTDKDSRGAYFYLSQKVRKWKWLDTC
jgi:hypothetical protein